jgi:hypothetical protein
MSSEATLPEENEAIVRRFFEEMFNGRNLDLAESIFAPNFTLYAAGIFEDEVRGPAGVRNLVEQFYDNCPDYSCSVIHQESIAPGTVMTYWKGQGTATGPGGQQSSVSTEYSNADLLWFGQAYSRISDGRIEAMGLTMVVSEANGERWRAGAEGYAEPVIPGVDNGLEAGEVYYRLRSDKPLKCRCCFCLCCG